MLRSRIFTALFFKCTKRRQFFYGSVCITSKLIEQKKSTSFCTNIKFAHTQYVSTVFYFIVAIEVRVPLPRCFILMLHSLSLSFFFFTSMFAISRLIFLLLFWANCLVWLLYNVSLAHTAFNAYIFHPECTIHCVWHMREREREGKRGSNWTFKHSDSYTRIQFSFKRFKKKCERTIWTNLTEKDLYFLLVVFFLISRYQQ